jgi:tetratricopeptide (TPR) repeat protein
MKKTSLFAIVIGLCSLAACSSTEQAAEKTEVEKTVSTPKKRSVEKPKPKPEDEVLVAKAQAAFDQSDYKTALKAYRRALDKNPDNQAAKDGVAQAYAKLKPDLEAIYNKAVQDYLAEQYDDALKGFEKVLEIDPTDKSALQYRDRTQKKIQALKDL